ncbi:Hypothetical protein ABZS17G119_00370 [Kosakonia cowanii]
MNLKEGTSVPFLLPAIQPSFHYSRSHFSTKSGAVALL